MKLKCYVGNLDGDREGLIVATSQKRAALIVGTSLYDFRQYWEEVKPPWPIDSLIYHTLYTRPMNPMGGKWFAGKCPKKG